MRSWLTCSFHTSANCEKFLCTLYVAIQTFMGQSVAEFDVKWRHWQDECVQRIEQGEFSSYPQLHIICRVRLSQPIHAFCRTFLSRTLCWAVLCFITPLSSRLCARFCLEKTRCFWRCEILRESGTVYSYRDCSTNIPLSNHSTCNITARYSDHVISVLTFVHLLLFSLLTSMYVLRLMILFQMYFALATATNSSWCLFW